MSVQSHVDEKLAAKKHQELVHVEAVVEVEESEVGMEQVEL